MTAVALPFPNSSILAGWWEQLAVRCSSALWVGAVRVHQLEVLANIPRPEPLDALARLVLAALDAERPPEAIADGLSTSLRQDSWVPPSRLQSSLGLDVALLRSVLDRLQRDGLVVANERRDTAPAWAVTPAGVAALELGQLCRAGLLRRTFRFLETSTSPCKACFAVLPGDEWVTQISSGSPASASPLAFLDVLESCLAEAPAWKQRHRFPQDVLGIVRTRAGESVDMGEREFWRRVAVDRPGQLSVVLSQEASDIHAFAVRPKDWSLHAAEPCFSFEDGSWQEFYPGLSDAQPALWRKAWLQWGQGRGLSTAELEDCSLERAGICLKAKAGKRLTDRLRSMRTDFWKGETWLLAGEGHIRCCARLEIAAS